MDKKTPTTAPVSAPPAALPEGIEIFKAGTHIDESGNAHTFSQADIATMAKSYKPEVHEAPLCVGHPASNLPSYGWVKNLDADGPSLKMNTHQVEPQFAEMVAAGRFKKRSASFYPPGHYRNPTPGAWHLRHVAFLGAQPPAIPGLKEIQFSEAEADGCISFSESVLPPASHQGHTMSHPSITPITTQEKVQMDEETQKKLAEAEAKAKAAAEAQAKAEAAKTEAEAKAKAAETKLAEFAESQRKDRHTAHVSFAEAQVKAGKLLPKDKATAVAVLDALAESQPVEFAEGDAQKKVAPAEWIKGLITHAKPVVNFGEFAPGTVDDNLMAEKGMSDAEVDKRAKAYAAQHKVNYAEAVSAVVSFTS